MGSILQIESLTKSFGDRILFSDISLGVAEGDKIGIIAKNGTGKSTLLRIITGSEDYDSGRITFRSDLRVGYLAQVPQLDPNLSIIDVCLSGDDALSLALRNYEQALADGNPDRIANAIAQMDSLSAWDYEMRFKQILSELKIFDFSQKTGDLSGGQVKRVALAKLLINNPELLILDEPTNHLDISMIEWLKATFREAVSHCCSSPTIGTSSTTCATVSSSLPTTQFMSTTATTTTISPSARNVWKP